jgi:glutamate 5-kinase
MSPAATTSARFKQPSLVVVKIGSNSLRGQDGRLDRAQIASLSRQVAAARGRGIDVVIVSSGAVAAGMGLLGLTSRPTDLPTLQAAAAAGQGDLVHEWQARLADHDLVGAQILLTQDDFVRRHRYLNARTTLRRLLDLGAIPVINENDAVATEELELGDNDHLAALVASMLEADLLVMLSDVDGLFDGDPRIDASASMIDQVKDPSVLNGAVIGGTGSGISRGGMRTKVDAARVVVASAAHAVVANARRADVLRDVLAGEQVGTWFVAAPVRLDARRLWIGYALKAHGQLSIDAGAVTALRERGVSLLAVGITAASGSFAAGDAVDVIGPDGIIVARGLTAFDAADLGRVAGMSMAAAMDAYGPAYAREVIHRDDLALR